MIAELSEVEKEEYEDAPWKSRDLIAVTNDINVFRRITALLSMPTPKTSLVVAKRKARREIRMLRSKKIKSRKNKKRMTKILQTVKSTNISSVVESVLKSLSYMN